MARIILYYCSFRHHTGQLKTVYFYIKLITHHNVVIKTHQAV